jgi:hypothetical protein
VSDEIRKLEKERDYWKRVASHLAGCHAATLSYDGMLKSTSIARRERFIRIVRTAHDMMEGMDWRAGASYAHSTPEYAKSLCADSLIDFPEVK